MSDAVPNKDEQDRVYREQREAGKSHAYAHAYASKIHEGEVFARHFAVIREKRALAKAKEAKENPNAAPVAAEEAPTPNLRKRTPHDFIFKQQVGEGSYSEVFLVTEKATNREFAVKVLDKEHIKREKKTKYVMIEKEVFNALDHPFIVRLHYTFQDDKKLYFVLGLASNGELLKWIKKLGSFDEECTRYYAAEILSALEHMHNKGIIHRDLKPENILLDDSMHVQLTDFGTAKFLSEEDDGHANSFVGTAQYVSPELLTDKLACKSSDLWALGCIVYQLLAGKVPFRAGNEYQTFKKITALDYSFPDGFPERAKDLVEKLLLLDPKARLGSEENGGFEALRQHPFFEGIKWDTLHETKPPQLDAYLPPMSPGDIPLHGHDDNADELADKMAAAYLQRAGSYNIEKVQRADERAKLLAHQAKESPWHSFLNSGELIIKTGLVDKRKGMFAKRRQLILTDTPRILYIDPETMTVKGEIPWSSDMFPQYKNMKIFFIHTPMRTYYLEDVERTSITWVDTIQQLLRMQKADLSTTKV